MNALPPTLSLGALILGAHTVHSLLLAYSGAFVVCSLLGGVLLVVAWRRTIQRDPPPGMVIEDLPSIWSSARPLFVVELTQAALLSLPIVALGHFATPLAVSQFSIANRLTMLISTVVLSIGSIVAPAFARHHRRGEYAELRQGQPPGAAGVDGDLPAPGGADGDRGPSAAGAARQSVADDGQRALCAGHRPGDLLPVPLPGHHAGDDRPRRTSCAGSAWPSWRSAPSCA